LARPVSSTLHKATQFLPIPLHHSTVTRLVNLGQQAAHSPTHHRIHRGCAMGQKGHGEASALVCLKRPPPRKRERNGLFRSGGSSVEVTTHPRVVRARKVSRMLTARPCLSCRWSTCLKRASIFRYRLGYCKRHIHNIQDT